MNTKAKIHGFSIAEVPIFFVDRTIGKSKMTKKSYSRHLGCNKNANS